MMNAAYHLIFSKTRGCLMAASETARHSFRG